MIFAKTVTDLQNVVTFWSILPSRYGSRSNLTPLSWPGARHEKRSWAFEVAVTVSYLAHVKTDDVNDANDNRYRFPCRFPVETDDVNDNRYRFPVETDDVNDNRYRFPCRFKIGTDDVNDSRYRFLCRSQIETFRAKTNDVNDDRPFLTRCNIGNDNRCR